MDCFSLASTAECGPRRRQQQSPRRATESMPPLSRVVSRRRQRQAEEAADRDKLQQQRHCRGSEAGRPSGPSPNPRVPPPHHHRSAEGPRRPARHQGPWVPWLWHPHRPCRWRPHLLLVVPQQTSHHRRQHRRCTEDRSSSKPPAAHPRCRWARSPRRLSERLGRLPLLGRRILLGCSRVDILRWGAAAGINALRNGDGCPLAILVQ
ncbi:hypothetical protein TcCL_Unassigned05169 [Trypanosoma cruzi]|nr:hypothetical protein TcCL_Unassigned05169 [Trypanosoma cruzi]